MTYSQRGMWVFFICLLAVSMASCGQVDVATTLGPTAVENQKMPTGPYIPNSAQLVLLEGESGSYSVPDVLSISLGLDTDYVEATILEIADTHGGIIVGASPDIRVYEVRFVGSDSAALAKIGETIQSRPDVVWAHPYVLDTLDSDI